MAVRRRVVTERVCARRLLFHELHLSRPTAFGLQRRAGSKPLSAIMTPPKISQQNHPRNHHHRQTLHGQGISKHALEDSRGHSASVLTFERRSL